MWKRIDKEHWQNHADRHLFWDKDLKCVATEAWTDDGVVMVVIPVDILREFLKENRYPSFTEVEFLAIGRQYDQKLNVTRELGEEALEYKTRLQEQYNKTCSLAQQLRHLETKHIENLAVLEHANKVILEEAATKKAHQKELVAVKLQIIKAGQAEIDKLRDEVKRLKDRYETPDKV